VVFDTRERQESADDMRLRVAHMMESLGATVDEVVDLGVRNFSSHANRRFTAGSYASYSISSPATFCNELINRLRLDATVNRTLVESI
jgi:ribosomal protein S6